MYKITEKEFQSPNVVKLVVEAPEISRSRKAGHFVIIRIDESGERVPLTIVDSDPEKGTITLIVQKVGVTSHKLTLLEKGDFILDVAGPLGKSTHIEKVGTVLCCGGGVGVAPLYPIVSAMKKAGNKVISVLAAKSANLLLLEKEINACSDEVIIMTDDGSRGKKGLITIGMEEIINREKVDLAIVIGPAIMMKFGALLTKKYGIKTMASLNTIMVDGTGMCGACRVTVDGKTAFVCVDGPEFDAHQVNFEEMLLRLNAYKEMEEESYSQCSLKPVLDER
ncbi:MAG: ferredoxin-NADP reductase [Bacteroidetes bacterium RIFCSPLOWO2_02_FULL_36_8]|nr:MAG: ferredoxin-NADP reductase [Bacteroidetes bacterium RIFCSPLOWO2_02_FULL_36_8]OFY71753.1 MAG: ferredoxin-NADP reductase [Bacteroidetes bacterium RIFCSPLOWO2_12_FULL_37_12]